MKFKDVKIGHKFQYIGTSNFPYEIKDCILKKLSPQTYRFVIKGDKEIFHMDAKAEVALIKDKN